MPLAAHAPARPAGHGAPLILTPPDARLGASVIVPVRNEGAALADTLAALAAQEDVRGIPLDPARYEVLVLANNCTDDTAEVARRFARRHPSFRLHVAEVALPPAQANVGTARRLVMDEAHRRLRQCGRPRGVIASTDGDTRVAPDWLAGILGEIAGGADAVGGRVFVEPGGDREARRFQLRDVAYLHGTAHLEALLDPDPADPWPRHHQWFGASLAVTADAYGRAGGLPAVAHLEDEALGRALRRLDARVRHSPQVRAWTSARQDGRVGCGLSTTLRAWGEMGRSGVSQRVERPAALEARLRARARLRGLWRGAGRLDCGALESVAEALLVPMGLLQDGLAERGRPFGLLWEAVEQMHQNDDGAWRRRWARADIAEALPALRARLSALQQVQPVKVGPVAVDGA